MPQEPVPITGVFLKRIGQYAIVEVEIAGKWVEVIREHADGFYSHIVEPLGIRRAAGDPDAIRATTFSASP